GVEDVACTGTDGPALGDQQVSPPHAFQVEHVWHQLAEAEQDKSAAEAEVHARPQGKDAKAHMLFPRYLLEVTQLVGHDVANGPTEHYLIDDVMLLGSFSGHPLLSP